MVAFDDRRVARAAFDDVGVDRALDEVIDLADFLGLFLENADEFLADDLALGLRVGDAGKFTQKALLDIRADEVHIELSAKDALDVVALVFAKKTVVDENAGELFADRLVNHDGRDRRVDAAGHRAEDAPVADLLAELFDRPLDKIAHDPVAGATADVKEEGAQDLGPLLGVVDLRMKLDRVESSFLAFHRGARTTLGRRSDGKTLRELGDIIGVAHPTNTFGSDLREKLRRAVIADDRASVFADAGRANRAAQDLRHHLRPVADPEDRDAGFEERPLEKRRVLTVDAFGAAGQDDALVVFGKDPVEADRIRKDLGVDVLLADAPRNELIVLSAEIEDQDLLVLENFLILKDLLVFEDLFLLEDHLVLHLFPSSCYKSGVTDAARFSSRTFLFCLPHNQFFPLRAGRNDRDGNAEFLFDEKNVIFGFLRERIEGLHAADVGLPAGERLKDRLCPLQTGGVREVARDLPVDFVSDADGDLGKITEAVDRGQGDFGRALDAAAVARCDAVKPAHPTRPSGRRTVFAGVSASSSQLVGFVPENLTGECSGADRGGIGLHNRDDLPDLIRGDARTDRTVTGECRRRGHHRVNAVIRVFHRAELALQEDLFTVADRVGKKCRDVRDIGLEPFAVGKRLLVDLLEIQRRLVVKMDDQRVFDRQDRLQLRPKRFRLEKQVDLDPGFRVFIRIKRSDARLRRAKGLPASSLLLALIKKNMIRHHDLGAVGNHEVRRGNSAADKRSDLLAKLRDMKRDSVSDDIDDILSKNTRRKLMERKFAVLVDDRVARVRAALEPNNDVGVRREHVGDLPLAFVAPVRADNCLDHVRLLADKP